MNILKIFDKLKFKRSKIDLEFFLKIMEAALKNFILLIYKQICSDKFTVVLFKVHFAPLPIFFFFNDWVNINMIPNAYAVTKKLK